MNIEIIQLTASIVSAYVSRNQVSKDELPGFIASIAAAVSGAPAATSGLLEPAKPAVAISKSIGDDFIICLIDGKKLTMLKRYLRAQHDISPEQYRRMFSLPHDYPMVAPAYARLRSAFAKNNKLGHKR